MADPKTPEHLEVECPHCDTTLSVDLEDLRDRFSAHGLHIVSEADRKVLRFMADVNSRRLAEMHDGISNLGAACDAELEARKTRKP